MRRRGLDHLHCSVARALDVVGDPWTLLVVRDLFWGRSRFNEIRESLDIPRNTLTARLEALLEAGVIEARPYQEAPVRHEYHLTEKGRSLHPVVIAMLQWGDRWGEFETPPVELVDRDGRVVEPVLVDAATGQPISELGVSPRHVG